MDTDKGQKIFALILETAEPVSRDMVELALRSETETREAYQKSLSATLGVTVTIRPTVGGNTP